MKRNILAWAGWLSITLFSGLLAGCVERRFIITSNPPGAIVLDEKDQPMGATPVDRQFTYYGKYRFTLVKDGYQTLVVEEPVRAPCYEWFPLEFISENLIPFNIRDIRRLHYTMQPPPVVPPEALLQGAEQRRQRGHAVEVPPPK